MAFTRILSAQWRGLSICWRPVLIHVGTYAGLCLLLATVFTGHDVQQYINRLLIVMAVVSVMMQMGGFVARLLWVGVAIGEAAWLASRCAQLVVPSLPVGLLQLVYAGLLLTVFILLARLGGDGGIRTLPQDPVLPITPSRSPVGSAR